VRVYGIHKSINLSAVTWTRSSLSRWKLARLRRGTTSCPDTTTPSHHHDSTTTPPHHHDTTAPSRHHNTTTPPSHHHDTTTPPPHHHDHHHTTMDELTRQYTNTTHNVPPHAPTCIHTPTPRHHHDTHTITMYESTPKLTNMRMIIKKNNVYLKYDLRLLHKHHVHANTHTQTPHITHKHTKCTNTHAHTQHNREAKGGHPSTQRRRHQPARRGKRHTPNANCQGGRRVYEYEVTWQKPNLSHVQKQTIYIHRNNFNPNSNKINKNTNNK